MKSPEEHFFHRLGLIGRYADEMKRACAKTHSRVDYHGCDIVTESIVVRFNGVRSLFKDTEDQTSFHIDTLPFVIGFYCNEIVPRPSQIAIHSPRGRFAHPNSDGVRVCVGEALPKLLPAEMLLLHVYRIITFQKFNLASAVDADVVRYVYEQPPDTFPTDRRPLF